MIQWSGFPHSLDLETFRKSEYPDFHERPVFTTFVISHMRVFPRFSDIEYLLISVLI